MDEGDAASIVNKTQIAFDDDMLMRFLTCLIKVMIFVNPKPPSSFIDYDDIKRSFFGNPRDHSMRYQH